MRAPITTTNSSKTVFGWFVAQETRLHRQLQLIHGRRALRAAFARFAKRNPRLVSSLFDAHFVETHVAPLVARSIDAGLPLRSETITAAWFAACRGPGASAASFDLSEITAAAKLLAYLDEELSQPAAVLEAARDTDDLFAEAVAADSSCELDWLWLASQVSDEEQRRFCYAKALFINPGSEVACRALADLHVRQPPPYELALGEA